jgi:hypothetical protein
VLGDLQSVYDGLFARFTGTRGKVEYKTHMSLLGCVTPLAVSRHHRYISEMGSRLLFYRVPSLTNEEKQAGLELLWNNANRKAQVNTYRKLASSYLHKLLLATPPAIKMTEEQKTQINRLASLLAKGRGVIRSAKTQFENDAGKTVSYYEPEEIQIEEPFRATLQLKTLAMGLAFVHGREAVTDHDLELLRRVVLSTMPVDRSSVLGLFGDSETQTDRGTLTYHSCQIGIQKSYGRAKQLLTELGLLEILEKVDSGSNEIHYRPRSEFSDLIRASWSPIDHILDIAKTADEPPAEKDHPERDPGDGAGSVGQLHKTPPTHDIFPL